MAWRSWLVTSLVAATASAHPVPTGRSVDVAERAPVLLLWVLPAGDAELRVTVLGGTARTGDALDLVDERGFLARSSIISVSRLQCGDTPYLDVRVRAPRGLRRQAGQVLAVLPPLATPSRARLLRTNEVGDPPPRGQSSLQALDADGDGSADVARYVTYNCEARTPGVEATTCIETWNRLEGRWQLVSAVECRPPFR